MSCLNLIAGRYYIEFLCSGEYYKAWVDYQPYEASTKYSPAVESNTEITELFSESGMDVLYLLQDSMHNTLLHEAAADSISSLIWNEKYNLDYL